MSPLLVALSWCLGTVPAAPESNQLTNPGFETGMTGWSFFARAADSASNAVISSGCHAGTGCLQATQNGERDWSLAASAIPAASVGETWVFTAWAKHLSGSGDVWLSFVTRDANGNTLDWNAAPVKVPTSAAAWSSLTARIVVPASCVSLQARVTGWGKRSVVLDDLVFRREAAAPTQSGPLVLRNDSLRATFDPLALNLHVVDSVTGRSTVFGGLKDFAFDSARKVADTFDISLRRLSNGWPMRMRLHLKGGGLRVRLGADSAMPVADDLMFPGPPTVNAGQRILVPRGTGLAIPVEGKYGNDMILQWVDFFGWQVTQGLTGITDGTTGLAISLDQPYDARMYLEDNGAGLLAPVVYLAGAKGVWGYDRSFVIAPLRRDGWAEMGRVHRARLQELGLVRTWTQKLAANPNVAKLKGGIDFWIKGEWPGLRASFFDSLKTMGVEGGVVGMAHGTDGFIDSLVKGGWLASMYSNYADAFPPTSGMQSLHYDDGPVIKEDGSILNGFLFTNQSGTSFQARQVCSKFHPASARQLTSEEQAKQKLNARFLDVELAGQLTECYSTVHGVNRYEDMKLRRHALGILKDTFALVLGTEQTRDHAAGLNDWAEGPMSILTTSGAGTDWAVPAPDEARMDSISLAPHRRVPALPLALHDVSTFTWYSGDGQSKVLSRWDDKDAWNALYASMPLIVPYGRKMWDSLKVRYLRSMVPLGEIHRQCGFEPMTGFAPLSADWTLQRTEFANGWSVVANFRPTHAAVGGDTLPPKGYLATNGVSRIGTLVLGGKTRTLVRAPDKWYFDPIQGDTAELDGIRTSKPVLIRKTSDTSMTINLVGGQTSIQFAPAKMYYSAGSVKVFVGSGSTAASVVDLGGGWYRLTGAAGSSFRFSGKFQVVKAEGRPGRVDGFRLFRRGAVLHAAWFGTRKSDRLRLEIFDAMGRNLLQRTMSAGAGEGELSLPHLPAAAFVRLVDGESVLVRRVPGI